MRVLANFFFRTKIHLLSPSSASASFRLAPPPPFMGKGLPPPASLERYARVVAERIRRSKVAKPDLKCLSSVKEEAAAIAASSRGIRRGMDEQKTQEGRFPLKDVVEDCTRRWFQDTLKEAKAGDPGMQVLVGQMYQSGYGVSKNEQKANAWITKASKYRSSVWKVSDKRPGYNASDSDSDEEKINIKSSAEWPGS